jgi:hypothetical protein
MFNYTEDLINKTVFEENHTFQFLFFDIEGRKMFFKPKIEMSYFAESSFEFLFLDDFLHVSVRSINNVSSNEYNYSTFLDQSQIDRFKEDAMDIFYCLNKTLKNVKTIEYVKPDINVSHPDGQIEIECHLCLMFKLNTHTDEILDSFIDSYITQLIQNYSFLNNGRFINNEDIGIFINALKITEKNLFFLDRHLNKHSKFDSIDKLINEEFRKYLSFKNEEEYKSAVELLYLNYTH